jgi:hypothetical protein
MTTPNQAAKNLKLALILATVAVAFFIGFIAKTAWLGV